MRAMSESCAPVEVWQQISSIWFDSIRSDSIDTTTDWQRIATAATSASAKETSPYDYSTWDKKKKKKKKYQEKMPKIFLLKNRLQEQQARLLAAQKGNERPTNSDDNELGELGSGGSSGNGNGKPVSLIVQAASANINNKVSDILKDKRTTSLPGKQLTKNIVTN